MRSSASPYSIELPPAEAFGNASYGELYRLSAEVYRTARSDEAANWRYAPNDGSPPPDSYLELFVRLNPHLMRHLAIPIIGAILFTVARATLSKIVISTLLHFELLQARHAKRFMESLYSAIFYSVSFSMAYRIESENRYLENPLKLWQGFSLADEIPSSIQWLYAGEASHYLHSTFAVFFVNQWIAIDSWIMFVHHIFGLVLLSVSFVAKMHRVAVIVVYLFDICDVVMETGKCLIKLRFVDARAQKCVEAAKVMLFATLLYLWYNFRLYQFPLKVIYSAAVCFAHNPIENWFPLSVTMFTLLISLFLLNFYWGLLLLKVLIKAIIGGAEEIEDIRDSEEIRIRKKELSLDVAPSIDHHNHNHRVPSQRSNSSNNSSSKKQK